MILGVRGVALLALASFSRVALGSDAAAIPSDKPVMIRVESGVVEVPSPTGTAAVPVPAGYYMTELGYQKLNGAVADLQHRAAAAEQSSADATAQLMQLQVQHAAPWKAILVCSLLAAGAGAGAVLLIKK